MKKNVEKKAVFLDRDGVINVDHGYVSRREDFEFSDGVFPALRALRAKGYSLIVVTNQSGIGRGYYTEEDFEILTAWMLKRFSEKRIEIAAVYSCPHDPDAECNCRKPKPGMFLDAIREYNLNPAMCWMIGDKESDMVAAESAGIVGRVLLGGVVSAHNTHSVACLSELMDILI